MVCHQVSAHSLNALGILPPSQATRPKPVVTAQRIAELEDAIERANNRCDEAYANFDAEAYEGAVAAGNRLYAELISLKSA